MMERPNGWIISIPHVTKCVVRKWYSNRQRNKHQWKVENWLVGFLSMGIPHKKEEMFIGIWLEWAESATLNTSLPNDGTLQRVEVLLQLLAGSSICSQQSWWIESRCYPVWITPVATTKIIMLHPLPQIRLKWIVMSYEPLPCSPSIRLVVGRVLTCSGRIIVRLFAVHPSKVTTKCLRTWSVSMPRCARRIWWKPCRFLFFC